MAHSRVGKAKTRIHFTTFSHLREGAERSEQQGADGHCALGMDGKNVARVLSAPEASGHKNGPFRSGTIISDVVKRSGPFYDASNAVPERMGYRITQVRLPTTAWKYAA